MNSPSHFGRYRVLRPLAKGEMGIVYLAEDPLIGRRVAIKGLRLDPCAEDNDIHVLQARFAQEIQIAGTFAHPNIVMLLDVGREGGFSFIAMEYVDGRNLRAELQASGPFPVERVIELIAPVARALTYAHERQIIHRDVKPTNILVSSDGIPKITDFGIARLYGSTLTRAGKIFGTPAYMSPEQTTGGTLTGASDQFALATVAYELLTGRRPFKGDSPTAVIYDVIHRDAPSPDEIDALIPKAVSKVVMRGLHKKPERRYASCDAFADALEGALQWARAHPGLSLLGGELPELGDPTLPTLVLRATVFHWWKMFRARAAELAADAVTSPFADRLRAVWGRIPARFRTAPTLVATVVGIGVLLLVAGWALPDGDALSRALVIPTSSPEAASATGPPGDRVPARSPTESAGEPGESVTSSPGRAPATRSRDVGAVVVRADLPFTVTTRPAGARVSLDGEDFGNAASVPLVVSSERRHLLRLSLDGYEPLAWSFSHDDLTDGHLSSRVLHFPLTRVAEEADANEEPSVDDAGAPDEGAVASDSTPTEDPAPIRLSESTSASMEAIPPTPGPVRRLRAPSETTPPQKIAHVDPVVASTTRGVVVLEIEISPRGNVVRAKLLRSLGPAIDQAALEAVVRWKYEPQAATGRPTNVIMNVTLPINGG